MFKIYLAYQKFNETGHDPTCDIKMVYRIPNNTLKTIVGLKEKMTTTDEKERQYKTGGSIQLANNSSRSKELKRIRTGSIVDDYG